MTVLLVLLTFVTFLLIDHFHSRKVVIAQPALQVPKRQACLLYTSDAADE